MPPQSPASQEPPLPQRRPFLLLDPARMPVALWAPNLLGYVRVAAFVCALLCEDRASERALNLLALSFALDYFDGPLARALGMCSQFGDLLDHVTDHVTMSYLVWLTSSSPANVTASFVCNGVACAYMLANGHYFKHAATPNRVQRAIEEHNYWNLPSLLWSANSIVIPLVKLSFHARFGIGATASTPFIDLIDLLGAAVGVAYTLSCVL